MPRDRSSRRAASPVPPATGSRLATPVLVAIGLVAAVAIVYAPVRGFGFVPLDDPLYITDNPHVATGLTWANVWWALTSRWASYWIPLTWMSYMAEVRAFGVRPDVMHVTNLLLHAANTVLLFSWLRRTTGAVGRSACAAALFALHPMHVESVAWITERKDVLSTFFLLLALGAYTRYAARPAPRRMLGLCALAAAGLMAKPMLVTLPLLLLLCDVWPLRRASIDLRSRDTHARWLALIREKTPLFALSAAAAAVVFVTQQRGGAMIASEVFPLGLRVQNAVVSSVLYLWQAVWPVDLIVWYPYPESIPAWQVLGALAVLGVVTAAVLRFRRFPYLAAGWFWYLVALLPVSGLIQVGLQPRADRFTYVPFIGLTIAVVWGVAELAGRSRAARMALAALAVVIVAACGAASRRQVSYWRDGLTLWGQAAEVSPGTGGAQAQLELARALLTAGRTADAIPHFQAAIADKPDWAGAHGGLGIALMQAGRRAEAIAEYEVSLRLDPTQAEIQNNLGAALATGGRFEDAVPHFQEAVRLDPAFESAHANLGVALMRLGRKAEAIQELQAALRINPGNDMAKRVLETLRH